MTTRLHHLAYELQCTPKALCPLGFWCALCGLV